MTDLEHIEARLDRLERQVAPLAETARAVGELREELAPRVNEAVQALIVELADVEADFQIEDLIHLVKKSMRNVRNLSFALESLKNLIDFAVTAEPLMKSTVPRFIYYLDGLERKGVFRVLNQGIEVLEKVGETYSQEQIDQIGDGLVRLLGMVEKLTQPAALDLLSRAAEVPQHVDLSTAKPVGAWGMLGALSDPEVKKGMGVLMALTRGLAAMQPEPPKS
jgi:uncharacterized protein YjgD (DUF1641 family)